MKLFSGSIRSSSTQRVTTSAMFLCNRLRAPRECPSFRGKLRPSEVINLPYLHSHSNRPGLTWRSRGLYGCHQLRDFVIALHSAKPTLDPEKAAGDPAQFHVAALPLL